MNNAGNQHTPYKKIPNISLDFPMENKIRNRVSSEDYGYKKENFEFYFRTLMGYLDGKDKNSTIDNREIFINYYKDIIDFRNYFDPDIEPIPKNKKNKEWYEKDKGKYSDYENPIILLEVPPRVPQDTNHSIHDGNLERFTNTALAVICHIWEAVFQKLYGVSYVVPEVKFFDGPVAKLEKTDGGVQYQISPIFHYGSMNSIFISRDVLHDIDFHTSPSSAIGVTLALAHEIGHSIQRQIPAVMTPADKEDMADFVAGYTLSIMGQMGLLGDEDLETALAFFAYIGSERVEGEERVHDTPEGRKAHLMRGYTSDIEGVRQEFEKYNPTKMYNEQVIKIIINGIDWKRKIEKSHLH